MWASDEERQEEFRSSTELVPKYPFNLTFTEAQAILREPSKYHPLTVDCALKVVEDNRHN